MSEKLRHDEQQGGRRQWVVKFNIYPEGRDASNLTDMHSVLPGSPLPEAGFIVVILWRIIQ